MQTRESLMDDSVPLKRNTSLISHDTALKMLSRELFNEDLDPNLVSLVVTNAMKSASEGHPEDDRQMQVFKIYWGFIGKPLIYREIGAHFGIRAERARQLEFHARRRVARFARAELKRRRSFEIIE